MLGKLTWDAIPLANPIPLIAAGVAGVMIGSVVLWAFL
jgi:hypothetical protein